MRVHLQATGGKHHPRLILQPSHVHEEEWHIHVCCCKGIPSHADSALGLVAKVREEAGASVMEWLPQDKAMKHEPTCGFQDQGTYDCILQANEIHERGCQIHTCRCKGELPCVISGDLCLPRERRRGGSVWHNAGCKSFVVSAE